jgi:hypothetical protein
MKIIDRKTFLSLPPGTLFSKYEPCAFGDLLIKGESITNDFYYQQIADSIDADSSDEFADSLEAAQRDGTGLEMDFDAQMRDGLFDEDQLFAVWERRDVEKLIVRLKRALAGEE